MNDKAAHQQALNRETWAALQDAGVSPGDPLTVDAYFFAPDAPTSALLAADLRADGWVADAHSRKEGFLRRRTTWAVQGTRRLAAVDLPALDGMVEVLVRRADDRGAEFDGWGAAAPGQAV